MDAQRSAYAWEKGLTAGSRKTAMARRKNELLKEDLGTEPALQLEWAALCEALDQAAPTAISTTAMSTRKVVINRGGGKSMGMQIKTSEITSIPTISWVSAGGAAAAAGVQVGDGVLSISGIDVGMKPSGEIVKIIQASGSLVPMVLADAGTFVVAVSPDVEYDRDDLTPESVSALGTGENERRSDKLGSLLKRLPRSALSPVQSDKKPAPTAGTRPGSAPGTKSAAASASQKAAARAPRASSTTATLTPPREKKTPTKKKATKNGHTLVASGSKHKGKKRGVGSDGAKPKPFSFGGGGGTADLFSYVSPLNRGVKYERTAEARKETHVPFWERDVSPRSKATAAAVGKAARAAGGDGAAKRKVSGKGGAQATTKEFIRQRRAAHRKLSKDGDGPVVELFDDVIARRPAGSHDGPPAVNDENAEPESEAELRPELDGGLHDSESGGAAVAVTATRAARESPTSTTQRMLPIGADAIINVPKTPSPVHVHDHDVGGPSTAPAPPSAASAELARKLETLGRAYDALAKNRVTEQAKWEHAKNKARREMENIKNSHAAAIEQLETAHAARLEAAVTETTERVQRAASARAPELTKEVTSQATMIAALEDTLKAKDQLLALKERSHAAELTDAVARAREEGAAKEAATREGLEAKVAALNGQLASEAEHYAAERQRFVAEKQAEMEAAIQSCTDAMKSMETGAATAESQSRSAEMLLEQMRGALAAKEDENAAMARRKDAELAASVTAHEAALELALAKKDREINTAMELAQAEVDRLLHGKQQEVETLLDERDLVIRSLQVQLAETRAPPADPAAASALDGAHLEEMVALKTKENAALETVLQREAQKLKAVERSNAELQARLDALEADRAEEAAQHQAMVAAMQQALTEAMSAKGDLLCLDECASTTVADVLRQSKPALHESAEETLARLEKALQHTDPSTNREVIRLKREIARLRREGVSEETIQKLTGITESALQAQQPLPAPAPPPPPPKVTRCAGTQTDAGEDADKAGAAAAAAADLAAEVARVRAEGEAALREEREALREASGKLQTLEAQVEPMREKVENYDVERRRLLNELQELKGNVRVFCRVRPFLPGEVAEGAADASHIVLPADLRTGELKVIDRTKKRLNGGVKKTMHRFEYNCLFDQESSQAAVFQDVKQLVQCAALGYNVCIFAYGQTGSGKTHTMTGGAEPGTHGLIPRAVHCLFDEIDALDRRGWTFRVHASFIEIYNEQIRDLLDGDGDGGEREEEAAAGPPTVKMGKDGRTIIANLREFVVRAPGDLARLLDVAVSHRSVGATEMNARSSRSHSVCRITLDGVHATSGTRVHSTVNMVDLAGSERLAVPSAAQINKAPLDERAALQEEASKRQTETLAINKSLSTLASVIHAVRTKSAHIPYRDSKLTHVLQDALGKDSKCLMMVNISPRSDCLPETLCSLRFAAKVNDTSLKDAKAPKSSRRAAGAAQ